MAETLLSGFPPVVGHAPRVLVLGSMPGVESLRRHEYYGHPRNAFWRIIADLFDIDTALDYEIRTEKLAKTGVALWDVVASCARPGSLDSAIETDTVVANDITGLLAEHASIRFVFFNGSRAEQLHHKHVDCLEHVTYQRLPSTSPAHAAMNYAAKLDAWRLLYAAISSSR